MTSQTRAALAWIIGVCLAVAGCAGREAPVRDLWPTYSLSASRTFEPEPGLVIHYTDEGREDGQTLLLVHGFAASVHAWRPWAERLRDDYRLVAIDLPGHGLTEAPEGYRASLDRNAELVDMLADHAGVDRFVLAGNSMGGAVSLAYAMKRPERLEALVLVDAAGWPGDEEAGRGGPPGLLGLLNNGMGRAFLKLFNVRSLAEDGLKSAYLDEALVTDDLIRRYADLAMARGHRDILLTQRSRPDKPWSPSDFAAIRLPVLVMSGEQDRLIPVDDARAIAAAIPGAELVTYPEGGHLPMEQLPDATVRDLRAFLSRTPGGGMP